MLSLDEKLIYAEVNKNYRNIICKKTYKYYTSTTIWKGWLFLNRTSTNYSTYIICFALNVFVIKINGLQNHRMHNFNREIYVMPIHQVKVHQLKSYCSIVE